VSVYNDNN